MTRWFRVYDDLVDDPKVQRLDPPLFKTLINLWCVTSTNDGVLPPIDEIAFKLRIKPQKAQRVLDRLKTEGLIEDDETGTHPHNWAGRQYKSDVGDPTAAQRMRRHRNRQRNDGVTQPVTSRSPETEAETEKLLAKEGRTLRVRRRPMLQAGFDWNPVNKQLYFSDNGRDWMSEDVPEDKLNRVTKVGQDFGAPYCYQGNLPDPEFGWGHSCSEFVPPVMLTGPRFYTGNMFPKKYKNAIFLARHGSWNRTKKFGGDVIAIFLNKDGTVKSSEPFITGFLENNNYIGRPVDVEIMKDGSMLLSDDWNGAIYHITYGKPRVAGR